MPDPAGGQLGKVLSTLDDKGGQRSSLGQPAVREQKRWAARPCCLCTRGGGRAGEGAQMWSRTSRVESRFCHLRAL